MTYNDLNILVNDLQEQKLDYYGYKVNFLEFETGDSAELNFEIPLRLEFDEVKECSLVYLQNTNHDNYKFLKYEVKRIIRGKNETK